jgi:hypothetical protein
MPHFPFRPGPAHKIQLSSNSAFAFNTTHSSQNMHRKNVALVGVNSRIGPAILDALLASDEKSHIYLFLRPSSKPPPVQDPRIKVITLPDPASLHDLTKTLESHAIEYIVSALSPAQLELQKLLADASIAAGVTRYILADYGSCRSDDPYILDLLPNFRKKREIREHCMRLVEDQKQEGHSGFSWTSIFTGHFFDYGLDTELLGLDIKGKKGILFDDGTDHWSTSTTAQIGRAVAAVIESEERLDATRNKVLLIQSFRVTQRQVLDIVNRLLGEGKGLNVKSVPSREFVKERIEGAAKGEYEAVEEMVAVLGLKRSDWKGDAGLANEILGLAEEDLEDVIARKLKDMGVI